MKTKNEILNILKGVDRAGMTALIKFLESSDFFTAPASSKFHLAEEGGLAKHSLNVYKVLRKLNIYCGVNLHPDSIKICGLLHDTCKIGIYKWSESQEKYLRDDKFPIGHSEKSIIVLQKFIPLTDEEIILIRWHMGAYDESLSRNQNHIQTHYPFYKLLYFADDISTQFFEEDKND